MEVEPLPACRSTQTYWNHQLIEERDEGRTLLPAPLGRLAGEAGVEVEWSPDQLYYLLLWVYQ